MALAVAGAAGGRGAGVLVTGYGAAAGLLAAVGALVLAALLLVRTANALTGTSPFIEAADCR